MPFCCVQPVLDQSVRGLCRKPYPNHPKGCPNFNKRATCPPTVPLIEKILVLTEPVYAIWNRFEFGEHVEKMRKAHPDWTDRQLANCLYWQGTARKALRVEVTAFETLCPSRLVLYVPEANGVNVTKTMARIGIRLQWPPKTVTYQVALAGVPAAQEGDLF